MNARAIPELRPIPGIDHRWQVSTEKELWSLARPLIGWQRLKLSNGAAYVVEDGGDRVALSAVTAWRLAFPELDEGARRKRQPHGETVAVALALAEMQRALEVLTARLDAGIVSRPAAPAPAPAVEPERRVHAATTGYWARLADVAAADLGFEALAQAMGMTESAVRQWVSGKNTPGAEAQARLERIGVAVLASRMGLDAQDLADVDEMRAAVRRGGVAEAVTLEEVMG